MTLRSRKQIDKVGSRFRKNTEQPGDRELIQEYRRFRCEHMQSLAGEISQLLDELPCLLGVRAKRTDTIIRKLRREKDMSLSTMGDVIGFRVLCANPTVQDLLVQRIERGLTSRRVRDSRIEPLQTGYRGYHFWGADDHPIPGATASTPFSYEIQVRTYFQHLWATESESFGEQVKEGGGTVTQREYLRALSDSFFEFERNNMTNDQVLLPTSSKAIKWMLIHFNKARGTLTRTPMSFDNFDTAIAYYEYLEDQFSRDLSQEIVLLGIQTDNGQQHLTHLRYWVLRGRPEIPDELLGSLTRPS